MRAFPQLAVLFQGDIVMGRYLRGEPGIQRGSILRGAARNRLDREGARFASLFQRALDGGDRDLKSSSDLGLAMALIDCPQDALA